MTTFKEASLHDVGYFILLLLLAAPAISVTRGTTITNWVGTSTRGLKNGSETDPFDGSTQAKFDAVMAAVPPDSTIIILPGTYQTKGTGHTNYNYTLPTGVKVCGSGMNLTILKLTATADSGTFVLGFRLGTNELVQDITLDCNYTPSLGKVTRHGLSFIGTQCTARRVCVTNIVYFDTNVNSEAWGIGVCPGDAYSTLQSTNNLFEQCIVHCYTKYGSTALGFPGSSVVPNAYGSSISGIMRSNRVYNAYAAFNGAWTHDWLIQGNYVQDGIAGLYGDTGTYTNVTLINNTFTNTLRPVYFMTTVRNGLIMASNSIYLPAGGSALVCDAAPTPFYYNFAIYSNTVARTDSSANMFLNISELIGLTVMNNRIDTNLAVQIGISAKVTICGNFDLNGNPYTNIDRGCTALSPPDNFRLIQ